MDFFSKVHSGCVCIDNKYSNAVLSYYSDDGTCSSKISADTSNCKAVVESVE